MTKLLMAFLTSAALSYTISGCEVPLEETGTAVGFTTLASGYSSGITAERLEAIRDDSAYTALWLEHTANVSPVPDRPYVDFGQDMVIAAFMGERPTGGYELAVTAIEEYTDTLVVQIKHVLPGSGCGVIQALTQPHHIVRLPRSAKVVVFQASVEQVDCT